MARYFKILYRCSPAVALVLVAFAASPSQTSFALVGGVDCNSQENMKLLTCLNAAGAACTIAGPQYGKCNMAMGSKTKLCNVDAGGGVCTGTTCVPNIFADAFSEETCDHKYN